MTNIARCTLVLLGALLAACGGGGGSGAPQPPPTYTIGGTVSGLAGTGLVLRNNAGNDLSVAAASSNFTFAAALAGGTAYNVTVATQPTGPSQTCAVTGGSGTVGTANVSAVQVACTTNGFTIGATVTGLDADGLVLQNNGGNDLGVASNGTVTFPGQTLSGAAFAITVKTQPTISPFPLPAQFCTVTNGSGTVGDGPVNVAITCAAPVYRYLYVANLDGNTLSAFSVNASTGALAAVPGSPFAADVRPFYTVPEPTGRFAYTTNRGDDTNPPRLSAYTVDAATGVLTPIAGQPFPFSVTPQPPGVNLPPPFPFVHRSGAFMYSAASVFGTGAWRLLGTAINPLTGALTEINGFPMDIGFTGTAPAQDSGGRVVFVATHATVGAQNGEIRTFNIHSPSGTLTPVGTFPTVSRQPSTLVTPGDNFVLSLGRSSGVIEVFAVDKSGGVPNGVLTAIGTPVPTGPPGSQPFAWQINRRNHVIYVTHSAGVDPPILSTFRLDPSTGALSAIGTPISTNGAGFSSAVLHPSGRFLLQHNSSTSSLQVFAIDPTTFAPTLLPNATPFPIGSILIDFSGKYIYASDPSANTASSYRFDTTTGAITLINTVPAGPYPTTVSPWGFQPQ
jgi:6-phosphogluconolactonase (cycloisomerase 2 family)